jgi:hypothetical protein
VVSTVTHRRVRVLPDWICEVISPTRAKDDTARKLRLYHRLAIGHYWIVDPRDATLTVMRWSREGYVTLLGETRSPRRVSTDVKEGTSAECPIVPGSTCPSPAQRGRGEPGTNLGHEVLVAERAGIVRAGPFEAVELSVGTLFGEDPA